MAHPKSEDIQFNLPIAVERLKGKQVSGEDAVNAYMAAGMPSHIACEIVSKMTNDQGTIDPEMFVECIQERIRIADLLNGFMAKKFHKSKAK